MEGKGNHKSETYFQRTLTACPSPRALPAGRPCRAGPCRARARAPATRARLGTLRLRARTPPPAAAGSTESSPSRCRPRNPTATGRRRGRCLRDDHVSQKESLMCIINTCSCLVMGEEATKVGWGVMSANIDRDILRAIITSCSAKNSM